MMSDETGRLSRLEASLDYIREKLDKLDALLTAVTRIQTDQGHHKDNLGRAFARIEEIERRLDHQEEETIVAHRALADAVEALNGRLRTQTALVLGAVAGAGAVWGTFTFLMGTDVVSVLRALNGVGG
jgi:chromosome segregation ATPase